MIIPISIRFQIDFGQKSRFRIDSILGVS